MFFSENTTAHSTTIFGIEPQSTTVNESRQEGNVFLSNSNDNSFQEFERPIDNVSTNRKYSLETDGNNVVTAHEGIIINSSSFATAELFELQSIGDKELFTTEECYGEQNENDSEKSIRLMDLLESKESCV